MTTTRRGFLGMLAGAAALAAVFKPKPAEPQRDYVCGVDPAGGPITDMFVHNGRIVVVRGNSVRFSERDPFMPNPNLDPQAKPCKVCGTVYPHALVWDC